MSKWPTKLVRTTRQYIGNRSSEVNTQARKGLLLLQIKEYIEAPDFQFWHEVERRYNELLALEQDVSDTRMFLLLADAVAEQGLVNESQSLYQSLKVGFFNSQDSKLAELARIADRKMQETKPSDRVFAAIRNQTVATDIDRPAATVGKESDSRREPMTNSDIVSSIEPSTAPSLAPADEVEIDSQLVAKSPLDNSDSTALTDSRLAQSGPAEIPVQVAAKDAGENLTTSEPETNDEVAGSIALDQPRQPEFEPMPIEQSSPALVVSPPRVPSEELANVEVDVVAIEENGEEILVPTEEAPQRLTHRESEPGVDSLPAANTPVQETLSESALASLSPAAIDPRRRTRIRTIKQWLGGRESEFGCIRGRCCKGR